MPPDAPESPWPRSALKAIHLGTPLVLHVGGPRSRQEALESLLDAWTGPSLQVDTLGCVDAPDLIRATGLALRLPSPGVTGAVAQALEPGTLLIWRKLQADDARTAAEALIAFGDGLAVVGFGAREIEGAECHGVTPPPHLSAPDALSLCPAGVPGEDLLSPRERLPPERLEGARPHADPAEAATELLPRAQELLSIAHGEALPAGLEHADLLFLRALVRHLPAGLPKAQAIAAAARLLGISGQLPLARELLDQGREAHGGEPRALLHWAEGDLLLRQGLTGAATGHHEAALRLLMKAQAPLLAATLLRRSADILAAMGESEEAISRMRRARALHRDHGDPLGVAETLRAAGDVAVHSGEVLSADALYEQAGAVMGEQPQTTLARANLCLGRAALSISRGETMGATLLLDQAEALGSSRPVVLAGALRLRADIHLRTGRHPEATAALDAAHALYLRAGEPQAAARCRRLQGDLAAAAGTLAEAADIYQQALGEAARLGDLRGARKVLRHLLVVERAGSDSLRVEELLQQLAEVDAELSSPERNQALRLG